MGTMPADAESDRGQPDERTGGGMAFRIYAAAVGAGVWAVTAFRAATTGITYDEAYTYLHYGRYLTGFLQVDVANNHPLNSLLVNLSGALAGVRYDELAIRAPNLIAFAIYLFCAYRLSRWKGYSYVGFSLLALNPYLDEFFGLGRGYGLATTAVLAAMLVFATSLNLDRKLILPSLLLCLASTAVYGCLVVLMSFAIHAAFVEIGIGHIRAFVRRNILGVSEVLVIAVALGYALSIVTGPGRPLPDSMVQDQNAVYALVTGYPSMFAPSALAGSILGILMLAILVAGAIAARRDIVRIPFTSMTILALLITTAGTAILGMPLPTGRLLLPFYPLLILALCESVKRLAELASPGQYRLAGAVGASLLCAALLANYAARVQLSRTTEWQADYPLRGLIYATLSDRQARPEIDMAVRAGNPVVEFYVLQIRDRIDPGYRVPLEWH